MVYHVVKVTLMQWEFVGHFSFKVSGNIKGIDVLNTFGTFDEFDQDMIEVFPENDCELHYDEMRDCYSAVLKNANGDRLAVSDEANIFDKMIVRLEIVDFTPSE